MLCLAATQHRTVHRSVWDHPRVFFFELKKNADELVAMANNNHLMTQQHKFSTRWMLSPDLFDSSYGMPLVWCFEKFTFAAGHQSHSRLIDSNDWQRWRRVSGIAGSVPDSEKCMPKFRHLGHDPPIMDNYYYMRDLTYWIRINVPIVSR